MFGPSKLLACAKGISQQLSGAGFRVAIRTERLKAHPRVGLSGRTLARNAQGDACHAVHGKLDALRKTRQYRMLLQGTVRVYLCMASGSEHHVSELLNAYAAGQRDFSGWSIRGGVLARENFEGCRFDGSEFREIVGAWSSFNNSSLEQAIFSNCLFFGISFVSSSLRGGRLAECTMDRSDFFRTSLARSHIDRCSLRWSCFLHADLSDCVTSQINVGGSLFGGTLLSANTLFGPDFRDCVVALPHRISGAELKQLHAMAYAASTLAKAPPDALASRLGLESSTGMFRAICASIPGIVNFLERGGISSDSLVPLRFAMNEWVPQPRGSVFLSYATEDQDFAGELAGVLTAAGLDVWFAPRSMRGGQKLYDQLVLEVDERDHVVFVASPASMASGWVQTELRRALASGTGSASRRVIPVLRCTESEWRSWRLIDENSGRDLAAELRAGRCYSFKESEPDQDQLAALREMIAELGATPQNSAAAGSTPVWESVE